MVASMQKWEYLTAPVIVHNTKAILDNFGADGWELVQVVEGPGGGLVAYFKRPPDPDGFAYWQRQLDNGKGLINAAKKIPQIKQIQDALGQSCGVPPESRASVIDAAKVARRSIAVALAAADAAIAEVEHAYGLAPSPSKPTTDPEVTNAAGHSDSNDDQRVQHDVGTAQDGRSQDRPRQSGSGKHR